MRLRSGAEFAPYALRNTFLHGTVPDNPISTTVNVEPLLQEAAALEDRRFVQGEDDTEGLGVTSRPSSPLTESESESEAPALPHPTSGSQPAAKRRRSAGAALPHPTSGPQSAAKRHRSAGAKKRRADKRTKLATSGHQPHSYAASPSVAVHHAEEQSPLRVSADAENFPAAESGSWVGLRKTETKKTPWDVSELVKHGFTFVEWDGL